MDSIKPIFITGVYRSGTTLISRILNNHQDLSVTYDSVHFMRFCFNNYNSIKDESNYRKLVEEVNDRIKLRWELELDVKKILDRIKNYDNIDYAHVYNEIMSNLLLKNSNIKNWGEKTNVCWRKIPDFLKMFPEGKTIMMIRDPRDILISYKNMTIEPGLRYLDAVFATLDSFHHIKRFSKELPAEKFYFIKHEDLVTQPEKTVQHVCKFLEIEYKPIMLESSKFKDKKGNEWKANTAFEKAVDGISSSTIGRWNTRISKVELYFVEMILREQMIDFEYPLAATPLEKKDWDKLFEILNDDFIKERYLSWIETGKGHQKYPNE